MKLNRLFMTLLVLCLCVFAHSVFAQTTEFTYQGRLIDGSLAASGTYRMQFSLFGSVAGSDQIGTTLTFDGSGGNPAPVEVTNGVFTVSLNFGANSFDGAARFVEISVFSTTTSAYVVLSPRQSVTSAPHSIRALNATTADLSTDTLNVGGTPAANIIIEGDTRLTDIRTPTANSPDYIQNQTAVPQPSTNFNIAGTGTANIFSAATQYNIGSERVLSNGGTGNIFVSAGAGQSNTTGGSNSFVGLNAGFSNTTGGSNSFFGRSAGDRNTTGGTNSFFGMNAGAFNTAGHDNAFFGMNAGSRTSSGDRNAFFGRAAGETNTVGNDNTVIGAFADVDSGTRTFATAVGAQAVVTASSRIQLGRDGFDTVRIGLFLAGGSANVCVIGTVLAHCTSSARYKENIRPFVSGLSLVRQLQPVTFDWIGREEHDLGLIAEEVEKVEPLLVTYNRNGEIQGVKYDQLSVIAVNAIKEQQTQIDKQQTLIEQQQKQIDDLRQIFCSLKPDASACAAEEN